MSQRKKPEPSKLQAGIQQLKIRACEMRSMELYYRAEADRLEECIRLLTVSRRPAPPVRFKAWQIRDLEQRTKVNP